uniref:Uncharacterized protein n=1 Tax=Glossina brevipalpis TaxID=37001 RepID=A0A1A9WHE1_9MUSC
MDTWTISNILLKALGIALPIFLIVCGVDVEQKHSSRKSRKSSLKITVNQKQQCAALTWESIALQFSTSYIYLRRSEGSRTEHRCAINNKLILNMFNIRTIVVVVVVVVIILFLIGLFAIIKNISLSETNRADLFEFMFVMRLPINDFLTCQVMAVCCINFYKSQGGTQGIIDERAD